VIVEFGKKKIYTAIISELHERKPVYETKEIISVLDLTPVINEKQFQFWKWLSEYYMCTTGEIFNAALPSGLKLESETNISLNMDVEILEISEPEELIIGILTSKEYQTVSQLQNQTDFNVIPVLKKMVDKGLITAEERIRDKYKPKYEEFISISQDLKNEFYLTTVLNKLNRAKKQSELLMSFLYLTKYGSDEKGGLKPGNEYLKSEVLKFCNTNTVHLNALIEKGYLIRVKKEVGRFISGPKIQNQENLLNENQIKALSEINEQFNQKNVVLLHGVTSSGKTELYIKLIKQHIDAGKQVLYLLPEIALTAQITERLKKIFGDKLGVYHSKFNDNERVDVWKYLQNKTYQVILGVRSSIFLPFTNLGLLIVDEEHENTYKQNQPAPRYHARDAGIVLAQIHGAKVLLGTATPSLESYYNAKTNKFGLVELSTRFRNMEMPEIYIADVREARRKKQMHSLFTPLLLNAVKESLEKKEQIILFQNRRGYSPYIECDACGYIPKCEHCDVSLTYHKHTENLVCHYCGFTETARKTCKACESPGVSNRGFGTQMIEDEIKTIFPEARISRMDLDSTGGKHAYSEIIYKFEKGQTDILIGTQMVTKGLDFDNVSLAGIMNADTMLNFPDFRAFERSYQQMAQVSGRAGRKHKTGKVIIQTSEKLHPILEYVRDNNYPGLFDSQIEVRKKYKYPPFYRLIQILVKDKQNVLVDSVAGLLADELKKIFGQRVLGPEYPLISRIKNKYIKTILIKYERNASSEIVKERLNNSIKLVKSIQKFKYVQIIIDVDPI
jgi:primosomal protein N' (replication factor Y)